MTFDYKKYSLENLEKWIEDAINSSEASPQEIFDVIKNVVADNYYCYKNHTERCYELLALLNGNGKGHIPAYDEYVEKKENLVCDKDDKSPECQKNWNDFWEENYYSEEHKVEDIMPPWGHSDMEALRYSEEELNAMCEKAASDEEKNKCREYNLREAEYYDKRAKLDAKWKPVSVPSKPLYVSEDGDVWIPDTVTKEDKVVKWQLPVEVDGLTGDCYVQFPDDLLEAANLKEGDTVEWIDRKDGSFELRKVNGTK
jgi:hypothetical protein